MTQTYLYSKSLCGTDPAVKRKHR